MAITTELEADILRCYRAEKWRTGTIARQLHVHHGTVRRVLGQAGLDQMDAKERRPSIIGDFLPVIRQTLERYPTLAAS